MYASLEWPISTQACEDPPIEILLQTVNLPHMAICDRITWDGGQREKRAV